MRWINSLSAIAALCLGTTDNISLAQHHHHHGSYWNSGHYDYHPAHYDVHRNHLHYHPGHYDYHTGPHVQFGGQTFFIRADTATDRRGVRRSSRNRSSTRSRFSRSRAT